MDLKSSKPSPILTDPALMDKSRLGIRSLLSCSQPGPLAIARRRTVKIEDVRANNDNGWLDAMRASSPPRKKSMKSINFEVGLDDAADSAYLSWLKKYPSALDAFDKIMNRAKNSRLAIFLDYDGTLSPIVEDPDRAFMSADMRLAVRHVAKHFPTAIITGRRRDQVYELVGLTELYYAGSHGLDIMFPDSTNHSRIDLSKGVNLFQPASEFLPMIDEVFSTLVDRMKDIKGAKVENHKFCTSVHYRNVDEKSWPTIAQRVHDVLGNYPRLRLTHGRKVLEIRPVIDWDKGKAVEYLLESLGLGNKSDLLPIYIGDDRTDEDAFKVLRKGSRGYGVIVSTVPKESKAIFSLRDPSEVKAFLEALVTTKEQQYDPSEKISS